MEPFSGNQRPDLPICLLEMSLVLRLPRVHVCRSSWNAPRMPLFLKPEKTITFYFLFAMCRIHCTCHAQWGFNIQKCSERGMCLACCRVRFLCSQTAKSAPDVVCFFHFELDMCFAPQPRALSQRCNFQKCPEHQTLLTFWLRNVLRATAAGTSTTTQLQRVLRHWDVFNILTSKSASHHNRMHIFDRANCVEQILVVHVFLW